MEDKNKIVPEKIHLNEIHFIRDEISTVEPNSSKEVTYDIRMAHNMMHNLEQQMVKIGLYIEVIDDELANENKLVGNYEIDFLFHIEDLMDHYEKIEDNIIFSGIFVSTLLGMCYSTTRGMLLEKWKSTSLEGIILPVISVSNLLQSKK